MKALPRGRCRVGVPTALAQLLETKCDQACRMDREMTPVNAYRMKWHVCSVERTLVPAKQSQLKIISSPTVKEASFPWSEGPPGTWLWLTSSNAKWNTVMEAICHPPTGLHKAPHTCSPAHSTPLPVHSPLQGCPTHGGNVLQLQETFGLLCSPSAQNSISVIHGQIHWSKV